MSRPIEITLSLNEAANLIAALRVTKDLLGDDAAKVLGPVADRVHALVIANANPKKTPGL